jgi:hypothetical protein
VNVTGVSTPGGAGYTPRANRLELEEGELEEEMMEDEQQGHGLPIELPSSSIGQCSPKLQVLQRKIGFLKKQIL